MLRGRSLRPATVGVRDGVVGDVPRRAVRDLPDGWIVAPGFVDVQVNGFAGAEVGSDADALGAIAAALPRIGVTGFCPTLVSRADAAYRRAAAALAGARVPDAAARPLGVHLEGPFLNPARHGAHDPGVLRDPDPAALDGLLAAFRPAIVTLAPELPGGLDAVARIARAGAVAAAGHTEAGAATARAAIDAGARLLTHAMNAMPGLHAREPGPLGAFLADRRARVSLIADGVHLDDASAFVCARAAGARLVLVSDAVAAAGMPPGRYRLGTRTVTSDGTRATSRGRLAGAVAGLDAGPRTLVRAGTPVAAALAAATSAPRRLLGLPPGLAPGGPADLVVLDGDLVPRLTLVGGRVAWADPGLPFDPGPYAGP
ncbi:MAG TPA: amidohydrolase family protein [Miltoncostaeaceae bacterium]|nr:amidohydrolase family protein [Miltoncostaeaceae bacterium]